MEPRKCKHCDWLDEDTKCCTLDPKWKEVDPEGLACKDFTETEAEPPRKLYRNIPKGR